MKQWDKDLTIKKWTVLDLFLEECKRQLIDRTITNHNISDSDLCSYVIFNQVDTLIYILEKNIPSVYDLTVIHVASTHKNLVPFYKNKILDIYRNRKVL